ncbi:hypothetical protein QFZ53_003603 [Microbacterium natoriense]|uniref:Uncharacterized protein n=1 Tax=Microbacterium natoriense TaxID=284570 RepID=A0AAW8F2D7_9MICO|nr:hypothetical protein [Microbacterium natoriense]
MATVSWDEVAGTVRVTWGNESRRFVEMYRANLSKVSVSKFSETIHVIVTSIWNDGAGELRFSIGSSVEITDSLLRI